jgi:hypothetical protein
MLRHARLPRPVTSQRAMLAAICRDWLARPLLRRKKAVVLTGTVLALVSVGSASAATTSGGSAARPAAATTMAPPPRVGMRALVASDFLGPHVADARRVTAATVSARVGPPAHPVGWQQVSDALNWRTNPAAAKKGQVPLADQLMPVGAVGPQLSMPISPAQYANASTIVRQTLAKRMGVRSAVIGIATAMQESRLLNLGYGTADSLGLFQQRPSAGWGTAQQIMTPSYAAGTFLTALQRHQAGDPGWASQPLWASAQAVQASGFPVAYARWEAQAAGLVKQIATGLF